MNASIIELNKAHNAVKTAQDVHGDEVVIISKKDAKAAGLDSYFTGKPCKHGHVSIRRVSNGVCIECKRNIDKSGRVDGLKAENNTALAGLPIPALDDTELVDLSATGLTTTGLALDRNLQKDEWISLMKVADKSKSFRQWLIGDLWNACEWGDKATHMDAMGINPKSAQEYSRVCNRIPHEMRRPNLSFGHHQALCVQAIGDEARMVQALDAVETRGMSVNDTKQWVRSLVGAAAEGDLEGGDENGADGTEGSEALNPFYGIPAKIKKILQQPDIAWTDEDIRRANEIKAWLDELGGAE